MGVKFGNLPCTVRGRVSYALSPFEQRAFAGAVSNGIPNLFKRFYGQVFRVTPAFFAFYFLYNWGNEENLKLSREAAKYEG